MIFFKKDLRCVQELKILRLEGALVCSYLACIGFQTPVVLRERSRLGRGNLL